MKYIRTKDGKILPTLWQDTSKAIKQADTIEELCDEFVVFYAGEPRIVKRKHLFDYWASKHEIYGAIWTGKGLIYVAKMNDKGELELL